MSCRSVSLLGSERILIERRPEAAQISDRLGEVQGVGQDEAESGGRAHGEEAPHADRTGLRGQHERDRYRGKCRDDAIIKGEVTLEETQEEEDGQGPGPRASPSLRAHDVHHQGDLDEQEAQRIALVVQAMHESGEHGRQEAGEVDEGGTRWPDRPRQGGQEDRRRDQAECDREDPEEAQVLAAEPHGIQAAQPFRTRRVSVVDRVIGACPRRARDALAGEPIAISGVREPEVLPESLAGEPLPRPHHAGLGAGVAVRAQAIAAEVHVHNIYQ